MPSAHIPNGGGLCLPPRLEWTLGWGLVESKPGPDYRGSQVKSVCTARWVELGKLR